MKNTFWFASILLLFVSGVFVLNVRASDEDAVRAVLMQNSAAVEKADLAALDKIWANDEAVTVFENGYANYGGLDYRNNHLGQELNEFANTKYPLSDVKIKTSGKTAWATFKYTFAADVGTRHSESSGLGTAVLEKRAGKWLIVHWHTSAPRRPPAPQAAPKS